jgi:type VI protein secretion system component Hcp
MKTKTNVKAGGKTSSTPTENISLSFTKVQFSY